LAGTIANFYPGITKTFLVTLSIGGVAQDIRSDTVTFWLKVHPSDADSEALIEKAADVATQGADGVAAFALTTSDTAVAVGRGYAEIVWELDSGEEYVVYHRPLRVLRRTSEV